jgi:transaldolase
MYKEIFSAGAFAALAAKGAQPQRLLWASTGAKNPRFSDIKYIEPLIGDNTINSMPLETLNAYRDHGRPRKSIELNFAQSRRVLEQLRAVGVDIDAATKRIEEEGVDKFNKSFDGLLSKIREMKSK